MNTQSEIHHRAVLVTGAGGFVGSHLTEHLVKQGARVTAFVRYNSRADWGMLEQLPKQTLSEIDIVMGDLRDSNAIQQATKNSEIVFHLGSLIAIPYSYIHPREAIETNITGTLNILEAARHNDVQKVIHTSTSEVYGTAQYVPIDEKHPLQGQSPYSASKIGADMITESYYRSFGVPVAIIRPFNTYGPRQSSRAIIPSMISQALTQEKIYCGSLHPTRDYTYVEDLISAFVKVADSAKSVGEVINIGSNFEISIGNIAESIQSILGTQVPIVTDPDRIRPEKSEVDRLWCDNAKARELLDWKPHVPFEEGLKRTASWISDNIDLYKTDRYIV